MLMNHCVLYAIYWINLTYLSSSLQLTPYWHFLQQFLLTEQYLNIFAILAMWAKVEDFLVLYNTKVGRSKVMFKNDGGPRSCVCAQIFQCT